MGEINFKNFCISQNDLQNASERFVGVKFSGGKPEIYFPYGSFLNIENATDEELREVFSSLMNVLSDNDLISEAENSNYASANEFNAKLDFPFQEFFFVLDYYLNFGIYKETEKVYKPGVHGKINWNRTIKYVQPQVFEGENGPGIVYLNLISSHISQNENQLVSLIHEFCVAKAQQLIGPLYGVEKTIEPTLEFDYDFFASVLNEKCSKTFNDRKLRLFHAMQIIVEYLQGNMVDGSLSEYCYGVATFAPIWEKMLDRIFGNLHEGENKQDFYPHCEWNFASGSKRDADDQKFAMRPDTIMRCGEDIFVVDAKFYTNYNLPTSSSISKQIVYAEFVRQMGFAQEDKIFNVFLLPYCCGKEHGETVPYEINFLGTASGDWLDGQKPYHKIAGILLDVKSVMRNYRRNEIAQYMLANVVKAAVEKAVVGETLKAARQA